MLMEFMQAHTPLGHHDIEQAGLEYVKHTRKDSTK